ncbi:MAG: SRPBCC domain-containing protein [Cyclobacteriaceae bacterium]|nr:SRPBCC domain-containing protein [Cyclobacteriaceae bacterium]MCB0500614.1 SRPBCC domain-containing protein [Cyclobacteriaceae bacterium]MCB9237431.1 SRPBCC domain-containing protein [Flammeovirgaceae bacterium]MCO5273100.1 SRPBCC domain-containing protein [Cyclobacteriaceae bacterium]MCW5903742.1 SRPBCC domain-containing protein [Cyclobacteriaceae bacterium]
MKIFLNFTILLIMPHLTFSQEGRKIELVEDINANVIEVWNDWTTEKGVKSFFAPECDIELKIGGKYECYFTLTNPVGLRGSEDCKVLSYLPYKMLSFQWGGRAGKHPTIRQEKTWVVIEFEKLDENKTRILFTNMGYRDGDEWDDAYNFFTTEWEGVLRQLKEKYEK